MNTKFTRREFIKSLSAGTVGVSIMALTGGCESLLKAIQNRPVRKVINTLTSADPVVQTYQAAVAAMKALPTTDPRNWTKQAEIHNNHCPHGNWYFLPWHRWYLFYFEQICRTLTGDDTFALPYWNWTMMRSIPGAFWGGASNPLFNNTRVATQTSQASTSNVGQPVMESILSLTDFFLFASQQSTTQRGFAGYGELEGTPHNYIHGFIGGDMGGYMSPLDAVFWTHHNMVDCCWANWNIDRNNPNINDTAWTQFTFTGNFVDGNGNAVNPTVGPCILMPLLSYRFEDSTKGNMTPSFNIADARRVKRILEEGTDLRLEPVNRYEVRRGIDVVLNEPASASITVEPDAYRSFLETNREDRLLLRIGGVKPPQQEDFFVRIFLNNPDASQTTSTDNPSYAGSFAFFTDEEHAHPDGLTYVVDLTNTIRSLSQRGQIRDFGKIDVRLVAVPMREDLQPREDRFSLGSIELDISRFTRPSQR